MSGRERGMIASQAVLIAVPVDAEGRRQILAVELTNRESKSSWREFLSELKQRCYGHFLRNALIYLPRRANNECLQELGRRGGV